MTPDSPDIAHRNARALVPATLLFALGSAIGLFGCGSKDGARELDTRAVVIGIDGADWKVIDALAATGGMPNLTRLRERGVSGPIETLNDIALSPVIWTSVATGKTFLQQSPTLVREFSPA